MTKFHCGFQPTLEHDEGKNGCIFIFMVFVFIWRYTYLSLHERPDALILWLSWSLSLSESARMSHAMKDQANMGEQIYFFFRFHGLCLCRKVDVWLTPWQLLNDSFYGQWMPCYFGCAFKVCEILLLAVLIFGVWWKRKVQVWWRAILNLIVASNQLPSMNIRRLDAFLLSWSILSVRKCAYVSLHERPGKYERPDTFTLSFPWPLVFVWKYAYVSLHGISGEYDNY